MVSVHFYRFFVSFSQIKITTNGFGVVKNFWDTFYNFFVSKNHLKMVVNLVRNRAVAGACILAGPTSIGISFETKHLGT
tara:strand:- start:1340 stop:1576 length:237 start_codon:yes stop_codon:yes gene_type:complete